MLDRKVFFDSVRAEPFGGSLTASQVAGTTIILDYWEKSGLGDLRWLAYMLATAFWETARTMQPIAEYGGRQRRYAPYYGRGFVQLTWLTNYTRASSVVGVNLVTDPDKAMEPDIAVVILFDGMTKGWFTGQKLADHIDGTLCDYVNARGIINGTDKAVTISSYAVAFEKGLKAASTPRPGVWPQPDLYAPKPADPPSPPASAPPSPDLPTRQPDDPGVPAPDWETLFARFVQWCVSLFTPKGN